MVKNLPAVQETWVRSLGQEDPLEKGIATPSRYSVYLTEPYLYLCEHCININLIL